MGKTISQMNAEIAARAILSVGVTLEEYDVADMLANIRHLCDTKGWDYGELDKQAYGYYIEELRDKEEF
jgi:hypothetical protein